MATRKMATRRTRVARGISGGRWKEKGRSEVGGGTWWDGLGARLTPLLVGSCNSHRIIWGGDGVGVGHWGFPFRTGGVPIQGPAELGLPPHLGQLRLAPCLPPSLTSPVGKGVGVEEALVAEGSIDLVQERQWRIC